MTRYVLKANHIIELLVVTNAEDSRGTKVTAGSDTGSDDTKTSDQHAGRGSY